MTAKPASPPGSENRIFTMALLCVVLLCGLRALAGNRGLDSVFGIADNDDIMRLLSVRSWLAGQSWFDMTQYGVLPPDGVSLHWTRYIDGALAGLIWLFGFVVPPVTAELWAAIAWPTLLLVLWIAVIGYGTGRVISPAAGIIAMAVAYFWEPISFGYFRPGRIDHHNVQILLLTIACFAALWPSVPKRAGIIMGVAAALSVTTGLETVFFLVALALLLLVQAAWDVEGARGKLSAFSLSVALTTTLAHLGQTAPSLWAHPMCDKLSLPYILVVWIGAGAALSFWALPQRWRGPLPMLCLAGGIAAIGLAAALPVLRPCLSDPYGHLPPEVQDFIATRVVEAASLMRFATTNAEGALNLFGLAFGTLALALCLLGLAGRPPRAVWPLLYLALVGFLASLFQVRQVVLLSAVIPALAGYALTQPFLLRKAGRAGAANAGLLMALLLIGVPFAFGDRLIAALTPASEATSQGIADSDCALPSVLAGLDAVPQGQVLSPLNLGPKIAAFTHHTAMSAPYHRSADALANGFVPFTQPQDAFKDWVQAAGAEYVLLCDGARYGPGAAALAAGEELAGFDRVADVAAPLLLFAVDPAP